MKKALILAVVVPFALLDLAASGAQEYAIIGLSYEHHGIQLEAGSGRATIWTESIGLSMDSWAMFEENTLGLFVSSSLTLITSVEVGADQYRVSLELDKSYPSMGLALILGPGYRFGLKAGQSFLLGAGLSCHQLAAALDTDAFGEVLIAQSLGVGASAAFEIPISGTYSLWLGLSASYDFLALPSSINGYEFVSSGYSDFSLRPYIGLITIRRNAQKDQ